MSKINILNDIDNLSIITIVMGVNNNYLTIDLQIL